MPERAVAELQHDVGIWGELALASLERHFVAQGVLGLPADQTVSSRLPDVDHELSDLQPVLQKQVAWRLAPPEKLSRRPFQRLRGQSGPPLVQAVEELVRTGQPSTHGSRRTVATEQPLRGKTAQPSVGRGRGREEEPLDLAAVRQLCSS